MREEFDIQLTVKNLYRYMIFHAYRGLAGILGTFLGLLFLLRFIATYAPVYCIFGIVLIVYTPVTLHLQAAKQYQKNEVYKNPLHYCLDEEGVTISQGDTEQKIGWDQITKAISSPDAILIYTGQKNACVLPKTQLGSQLPAVVKMISTHLEPKKVRIRGNL